MARIGFVILVVVISVLMGVAMYAFSQDKTNIIEAVAGETVKIGSVEYTITFDELFEGDKDTKPEHTFVKIKINAENIGEEKTILSGGQFYFVDERNQKHEAVYGEFSEKDLLLVSLEPGKPVEKTTQFDIPFDEEQQYKIILRPQKGQSSSDVAIFCITNC